MLISSKEFDNSDQTGRAFLPGARMVLTTPAGANRLGGNAIGLENWQSIDIPSKQDQVLRVVGTPARHGPQGADRGPVTGFVFWASDEPDYSVYVSGDTV